MAAETKSDLLDVTRKELAKLLKLIDNIDPIFAIQTDSDGISIKDIVAHRAHWIKLFLGWYVDGRAGRRVHFPAEGYKWSDLKRYNADLRARQSDVSWIDAVRRLEERSQQLLVFIERLSDRQLYGAPMQGAKNHWTTGRWAEAAGASHFRSAAKFIRAAKRAAQDA